jgi:hypothetical protein
MLLLFRLQFLQIQTFFMWYFSTLSLLLSSISNCNNDPTHEKEFLISHSSLPRFHFQNVHFKIPFPGWNDIEMIVWLYITLIRVPSMKIFYENNLNSFQERFQFYILPLPILYTLSFFPKNSCSCKMYMKYSVDIITY